MSHRLGVAWDMMMPKKAKSSQVVAVASGLIWVMMTIAWTPTLAVERLAYSVSPSGSDTPRAGTPSQPWRTLAHACAKVWRNGAVIKLDAGVFEETAPCKLAPGVSIEGMGVGVTTVKAGFNEWLIQGLSQTANTRSQTLSGFTIDGKSRTLKGGALFQNRSGVVVQKMRFQDFETSALQITGTAGQDEKPPKISIAGIIVSDNEFFRCGKDYGTWSGGCLQIGHLKGGLISDNRVTEDVGAGIKQWAGGWFEGTEVTRNKVTVPDVDKAWGADISIEMWNLSKGCRVTENEVSGWISIVAGRSATTGIRAAYIQRNRITVRVKENSKEGLELAGIGDVEVSENTILGAKYGIGLWESNPGKGNSKILIHHNKIGGRADGEGVRIHSGVGVEVLNNLFFDLEKAIAFHTNRVNISDVAFINNLLVDTRHGVVFIAKSGSISGVRTGNNYLESVGESFANWGDKVLAPMPREQLGIVGQGNFRVGRDGAYITRLGSSLTDRGIPSGLPYCGARPDIGPEELCATGEERRIEAREVAAPR